MGKECTLELDEQAREREEKLVMMSLQQEDMGTHGHRFFELSYITGGASLHTLNGVSGSVRKGDYFLLDYGSVHSFENSRNLTLINCLFLPEVIDDTLAGCQTIEELLRVCLIRYHRQYYGRSPSNRVFHDEDGEILNLLQGMQAEYQVKNTGYAEIFRCRLLEILIRIMRKILQGEAQSGKNRQQSTLVREAIEYLNVHYRERMVTGRFCEEYHYSPQYVSRRFRQETGLTALEYLQKMRIERSCELLSGSEMQIQEIAREVGYEDVKFFGKVFRKLLHMSPGEYRRMTLYSASF